MSNIPFLGDYGYVPPSPPAQIGNLNQSSNSSPNIFYIFLGVGALIIIAGLIIYFLTKRKDIKQLFPLLKNCLNYQTDGNALSGSGKTSWTPSSGNSFSGEY